MLFVKQFFHQIVAFYLLQEADDLRAVFGEVPEEETALGQFFFFCAGAGDVFQRVGVDAGVVYFGCQRHRCWREILYLLQVEVHFLCLDGQAGHVGVRAAGVARDEVGD